MQYTVVGRGILAKKITVTVHRKTIMEALKAVRPKFHRIDRFDGLPYKDEEATRIKE